MNFGERLRLLRIGAKLTMAELARPLGLTAEDIAAFEAGERCPDINQLHAIAQTFSVPESMLICDVCTKKRTKKDAIVPLCPELQKDSDVKEMMSNAFDTLFNTTEKE